MFASEIPDVQLPMNTYGRMSTNINVITGLHIFFVVKLMKDLNFHHKFDINNEK